MTPRFLKARVGATVSALLATMLTAGLAYVTAAPAAAATIALTFDCDAWPTAGSGGWVAGSTSNEVGRRVQVDPGDIVTIATQHCANGQVFGRTNVSGTSEGTLTQSASSSMFQIASTTTLNGVTATAATWVSPVGGDTLTITVPTTIPKTEGSFFTGNFFANTIVRVLNSQYKAAYFSLVSTREARIGSISLGSYPSQISLNEGFSSETTTYTASTMQSSTQVNVTKLLDWSNAATAVSCNGSSINVGGMCALSIGSNTIAVTQTALDGSTTRTYTITVTRSQGGQPQNPNQQQVQQQVALLVVPVRNDIPYVTANDVTKSADGGRVALKGEKLTEVKSITVGGKKVDTFTVNASGQLEFALPTGLTGEQDVQLTGKDSVLSFRVNATPTTTPAVTAPVVPVLTKVSTVVRKGNAVKIASAAWMGVTTQTHQLYVCSTQTWAGVGAAAPAGCIPTQTSASDASSFSVDLKPRWAGKYLVVVTTVANSAGTTTKSWSNSVRI